MNAISTFGATLFQRKRIAFSSIQYHGRLVANHPRAANSSRISSRISRSSSSRRSSSEVLQQQFLLELQKDPTLFVKLWESASPNIRQTTIIQPLLKKSLVMSDATTKNSTITSQELFVRADRNGDGVLTATEFDHWLTNTLKRSSSSATTVSSLQTCTTTSSNNCTISSSSSGGGADGAAASITTTRIISPSAEKQTTSSSSSSIITRQQWQQVCLMSAIPFVGFGFFDNAIMICSGSYLETTFCTAWGLSAMAAAALGNTLSDVAGIQAGGWIERLASKMGHLKDPQLTLEQMKSRPVQRVTLMSSAVGMTIGCLLGMIPLLFYEPQQ